MGLLAQPQFAHDSVILLYFTKQVIRNTTVPAIAQNREDLIRRRHISGHQLASAPTLDQHNTRSSKAEDMAGIITVDDFQHYLTPTDVLSDSQNAIHAILRHVLGNYIHLQHVYNLLSFLLAFRLIIV